MNTDFLDAHDRHRQDADLLFEASRWANADHLYGVAAECGLKRLMMLFGMQVEATTGAPKNLQDRAHINEAKKGSAWDRYESYRSGYTAGASYPLPTINPYADWDVAQRYAHQSHFDEVRAKVHQNGANVVHVLIKKAKLDGLFS
ncbi:hypothetical protein ACFQNF_14385 [Iodobacter arcticus]|uniref:SAM-dependent methyltransferase n=1 Tax=Iodobacter arcticus TaxID=590593 RepID=A0ABW2R1I6_9NEIS